MNIGRDAEAYIALCRQGDQLGYYYRAETPVPNQTWLLIHRHTISTGNVDVGLTASGAPASGEDSGVEGHFNWVVFQDYSSAPAVDGCEGALKKFVVPVGG